MQVKVILVNFQEEYLKRHGKWYTKTNIDKFVINRFLPFCDRHEIKYYMIKSDYSQPNKLSREGCIPNSPGFRSLIKLSRCAGPVFTKADDSPNFIREAPATSPVEKPSAFKKWLDENIGNPDYLQYVVLVGVGIEASLTLVGYQLTKYGYNVRLLKEGCVATNRKYTQFLQDKYPLSEWGESISFSKFVTEYNKFKKEAEPFSNWAPSENIDAISEAPEDHRIADAPEEEAPALEPQPEPEDTPSIPRNLSKEETIALMKQQMKAQYMNTNTIKEEAGIEAQPEEFNMMEAAEAEDEPIISYEVGHEEVPAINPVEKPVTKKSLKEEQQDALEAARRRVAAFYGEEIEEDEPEEVKKPAPTPEPELDPVVEEIEDEEFISEEPSFFTNEELPFENTPDNYDVKPVTRTASVESTDEYRYANVYNSMIEITNDYYENANDNEPIKFVKSKIYGEGGKKIKPKAKASDKMSTHEKYVLLGEQKRKAYALRGEKYKPDDGVDESLR